MKRFSAPALALALALAAGPALAQEEPLAVGDMVAGHYRATVEVVEANRSEGILNISLHFLGGEDVPEANQTVILYGRPEDGYDTIYIVAEDRRYHPMRDAQSGGVMMPHRFVLEFEDGAAFANWTGSFPAPPEEVEEISLIFPLTTPLYGIAISDP